jgi:hypothetical protein
MTDDNNPHNWLIERREALLTGQSAYGDPSSHRAKEKLAEYDARIAHHRATGELPPDDPWTPEKVGRERLAASFPGGDPSAAEMAPEKVEFFRQKFEAIGHRDPRELKAARDETAADLAHNASPVSLRHANYRHDLQGYQAGVTQLRALTDEAKPAIEQFARASGQDPLKLLEYIGTDRQTLEYFASKGRNISNYAARKKALGL